MWQENSQRRRALRLEKKIAKWKPEVIANIREELENKIRKEYLEEIEKLSDDLYEVRRESKINANNAIHYKAKFEEYKERYLETIDKLEKKSESLGEVKTELKEVKNDLEDVKSDLDIALGTEEVPLEEDKDFQKELKTLITRCNKPDAKKSDLISAFSVKWSVSLKEVVNKDDDSISFTWKSIKTD